MLKFFVLIGIISVILFGLFLGSLLVSLLPRSLVIISAILLFVACFMKLSRLYRDE